MKRFAVPLVILGSLAVLVAAVQLLRAMSSESPAATATSPAPRSPAPQTPPPAPIATPSPATPAPRPPVVRPQPAAPAGTTDRAEPAPTPSSNDAPPTTLGNTKGLQYGLIQLREKITANAPHVAACIGSSKPTGEATLTFIVAKKGDKYIIEQPDVDHDKSTLQDEKLLDCLAKTASAIQIDGLPREADAIIVTRVTTLKDGAIAEDKPLQFSYLR